MSFITAEMCEKKLEGLLEAYEAASVEGPFLSDTEGGSKQNHDLEKISRQIRFWDKMRSKAMGRDSFAVFSTDSHRRSV